MAILTYITNRGLHSYAMVQKTVASGCDYLGRIPKNVKFPVEKPMDNGSYCSRIHPPAKMGKKGCQPILVRVIELKIEELENSSEPNRYRLITSLLETGLTQRNPVKTVNHCF